jgi:hypothetical protein
VAYYGYTETLRVNLLRGWRRGPGFRLAVFWFMTESASVANVKSVVRKAALHPAVCSWSYSFWRQERELNATSICALHTTRQGMSQYNSQYPLGPLLNTKFAIYLRTITFLLAPSRSSSWPSSKMFPYKNSHFPSLPSSPFHSAQHYEDVLASGRHEPIFSFLHSNKTTSGTQTIYLPTVKGGSFPTNGMTGACNSLIRSSITEDKNVRSYTSTIPYLLLASFNNQRDKFDLTAYP